MTDTANRAGPTLLTTVAATIYAPTGVTGNLLTIHVVNDTAAPVTLTMSIGADALGKRFFPIGFQVPANGTADWDGFMPIHSGEIVQAYAGAANALTVTMGMVETT